MGFGLSSQRRGGTQRKTAFTWKSEQYFWTQLPQGFHNSLSIFHQKLKEVLKALNTKDKWWAQYVNAILIMTETRESCLERTKQVLEVVEKMGLKLNGTKAQPVTQRWNS